MSEELKPEACPCCGSAAYSHAIEPHGHLLCNAHDHPGSGYVECEGCNLAMSATTEAEAVAAWNRRASTPTPPASSAGEVEGWRPIETAPKDGTEILTVGIDSRNVIATKWLSPGPFVRTPHGAYYKDDGWYWAGWDVAVGPVRPTHWSPLPAPPVAALASDAGREGGE